MTRSERYKRLGISALIGTIAIGGFQIVIPRVGWTIGGLLALLIVAWRHDNDVGAFFPLAVALVLLVLILSLFLVLMAIVL